MIHETLDTPIGGLFLLEGEDGALHVAEFADRPERVERALRRLGLTSGEVGEGPVAAKTAAALRAYFDGRLDALAEIEVALVGTAFQRQVWSALRKIPAGAALAYGAFAARIGRPQASRAVGHANGANPLSIIVPCHRLVGADGALTNYGGGLERKRWLLDHEARHASA